MKKKTLRNLSHAAVATCLLLISSMVIAQDVPSTRPPGKSKTTETKMLETGAAIMQTQAPLRAMDIYITGLHPMKNNPQMQMEAHHFCHQVNEDFAQCALFDGNKATSNLNGIEYIISESAFQALPEAEKQYWHPHNYEILSGQLVAPGLPEVAEKQMLKKKMNSYGKTWHVWHSGNSNHPADKMPLGEPQLAWSLNYDGEADPKLLESYQKNLHITMAEKRQSRQELIPLANPQSGVSVLREAYFDKRLLTPLPGVMEKSGTISTPRAMTPIPSPLPAP